MLVRSSLASVSLFAFALLAQAPPAAPKPAAPKPAAPKPAAAKPAVAPAKPAREPGLYATLYISHGTAPMGTITFKFYEKESPVTVKNFVDLAQGRKEWLNPKTGTRVKLPLYTGLTFHRVIPDFMIQGGDPQGNGMGGTDPIIDEFHPSLRFDIPGRVAMANAGPGTGSSQFFITEGRPEHLNGRHTIFGQVVEGQELVNRIARVPRGRGDKPDTPVRMTRVVITRVPDPNAPKPAAPAVRKAAPAVKKATPAAPAKKS
ncbi:MAG TPA: peptidylprolyl isomerase [Bryobacteraceae bacterium]|nr:peptidylprolyl isomerase [Bryobacteraceae bacterium]